VNGRVCIAIHDVAPATWPACARLLALLDELGAPALTLLVVPDYHHRGRVNLDAEFRCAIDARLARGDEVALHGYYHLDDAPVPRDPLAWIHRRVLTNSEGEFAALDVDAASERIARGLHAFTLCDWPVRGFVAPAWLLGDGARAALARSSLAWTSTHTRLESLDDGRRVEATAISASARSRWRRQASLAWLAIAAQATRSDALVRVALHPADAAHANLLDAWRTLLQTLLSQREALTKAAALAAPPPHRGRPLRVNMTAQPAQAIADAR
jgi:predicted deacetylase